MVSLCIFLLQACSKKLDRQVNHAWKDECSGGTYLIKENQFTSELRYQDRKSRRCEIASHDYLKIDQPFHISFSFSTNNVNTADHQWHSIFQIHSFPDSGERWRCPVLALEVKNGKLRMFNRWDANKISNLINGTCAAEGNSIRSRKVFAGYPIKANEIYQIVIKGTLSSGREGLLEVMINGKTLDSYKGANAFNDLRGPYLKFGIYKPTSWLSTDSLSYYYNDLIFQGERVWK